MKNVDLKTEDIQITSVYFSKNGTRLQFQSYPRKLVYRGRVYILSEN